MLSAIVHGRVHHSQNLTGDHRVFLDQAATFEGERRRYRSIGSQVEGGLLAKMAATFRDTLESFDAQVVAGSQPGFTGVV